MNHYWSPDGYDVVFPDGHRQRMDKTIQAQLVAARHNHDLEHAVREAVGERDSEIARLRAAIARHRAQKFDGWAHDVELYEAAGLRCGGGGRRSHAEPEAEIAALRERADGPGGRADPPSHANEGKPCPPQPSP